MAVQLISYDLRAPGRNYSELHKQIESYGNYWHCLESVWMVVTNSSTSAVRDHLINYIDANDLLIVLKLEGDWATKGFADDCNNWLKNNL